MFRLGVTGGIGSGKTTVCRVFNVLGIPVFSADDQARIIMDSDRDIAGEVNRIAGRDMYVSGRLDRQGLAELIFSHGEMLGRINSIVHPAVREHFNNWVKLQESDYVILEAAILIESGSGEITDRILTVVAPVEERIERVMRRNNLTREEVIARINNQSSDEYKIGRSHYVIDNTDNAMILPEIIRIHNDILSYIRKSG
mgnify:CR=1 FL=1